MAGKSSVSPAKSWQYLLYIYLILPGILYLIAWLTQKPALAKIFHGYCIYGISTVPNLSSFTGCVGAVIAAWFLIDALRHKRWLDLAVSAAMVAAVTVFFASGWNYLLLSPLSFQ